MKSDEKQALDASRRVGSFDPASLRPDVAECVRKRWLSMGWLNADGTLTAKGMGRGWVPQVEVPLPMESPTDPPKKRRRSKKEVSAAMFPAMEEPTIDALPDEEVAPPIISGEPEEVAPPIVPEDADADVIVDEEPEA